MKKTLVLIMVFSVVLGIGGIGFGMEFSFDLDDMFSDGFLVEEEFIVSENVDQELHEKRISLTGQVGTVSVYSVDSAKEAFFGGANEDGTSLQNKITSDLSVDVRIDGGVRSLINVSLDYFPMGVEETTVIYVSGQPVPVTSKKYSDIAVNEFFLDTNYDRKVYFRTGKQVLKWGRSYFWNPTDLINVEYKDITDTTSQVKEGTYGVRVHMPFGITRNLYFFAGMDDVERLEDVSLAAKYEFLVGNTEMGFSAWYKKDYKPVYGYDLSGRMGGVDLRGEIALSHGDNRQMMDYDTLAVTTSDTWVPRVSLGATKFFDYGGVSDRISVSGEFYYNHVGYDENIFARLADQDLETKLAYLTSVYEPYRNSKYYLALFASVQRFGNVNTTLHLNGIANLVDRSATLSGGVSYRMPLSDVSIDLSISRNIGDENTEATFHGNRYRVMLGTTMRF